MFDIIAEALPLIDFQEIDRDARNNIEGDLNRLDEYEQEEFASVYNTRNGWRHDHRRLTFEQIINYYFYNIR